MNQIQTTSYINKILILIFELGFAISFNLVGTISVSEIFLILYFVLHFYDEPLRENFNFNQFAKYYGLLLCVQITTEVVVGNTFANAAKGIAVTGVSFLHFYFLLNMFLKDKMLVVWALLGILLRPFIFGTEFTGNAEDALLGDDATFLKFVLAPIIINGLLIYSVVSERRSSSFLFIAIGLVFIVAGARSSGVMTFLTGIIAWFVTKRIFFERFEIIICSIVFSILMYGAYSVYVTNVLNGNITSGNSEQLKRVENPYNPIKLLMVGRAETFVGASAFMDKPLTGWGQWKSDADIGYKYHALQSVINSSDRDFDSNMVFNNVIPTHSVIVSYGAFNGIFALILILCILFEALSMGIKAIPHSEIYALLLINFIIQLLWNALFSPTSHFRLSLPLYMAFMVIMYWDFQENQNYELLEDVKNE